MKIGHGHLEPFSKPNIMLVNYNYIVKEVIIVLIKHTCTCVLLI